METGLHQVYLGLGSNLGNREAMISKAVSRIGEKVGQIVRQSSLIASEPWGFVSEHQFLNAVVLCTTTLSPRQVLTVTQKIERELGKDFRHATQREKHAGKVVTHYHDRPIDIDILLYDDLTVDEPDLKIPHPRMTERDFVMKPLNEIRGHSQ